MKILLSLFAAAVIASCGAAFASGAKTVDGIVQSVSGSTLTVKTDDGRTTIVDVSETDRPRVAVGEKVIAVGEFAPEQNSFKARAIQVARSDS